MLYSQGAIATLVVILSYLMVSRVRFRSFKNVRPTKLTLATIFFVLAAYKAFDDIGILSYRVYRYPQLQRDVDTRNQAIAGRFQRVGAVFAKFGTATAWFDNGYHGEVWGRLHWLAIVPEFLDRPTALPSPRTAVLGCRS